MKQFASLVAALFLLLPAGAIAKAADTSIYPEHTSSMGLVNDFAGIMTDAEKAPVEAKLRTFAHSNNVQIVVVTVPSLHGIPISVYNHELFKRWGPGIKGADNGVIFLIAPYDHRMRIDVGTRLEPYLTDATSRIILRKVHDTNHATGRLAAGIAVGADEIMSVLGPALAQDRNEPMTHATPEKHGISSFWIVSGIVLAFIAFVFLWAAFPRSREEESPENDDDSFEPHRPYGNRMGDYPFHSGVGRTAAAAAVASSFSHEDEEEEHYGSEDDTISIGGLGSSDDSDDSSESDGISLGGGSSAGGGAEDET